MEVLKRINTKGYEEQQDPYTLKWVKTHVLVANQNPLAKLSAFCRITMNPKLGRFLVVHHKDFDKLNNSPDNLEWLGNVEHFSQHSELAKKLWKDPEYREVRRVAVKKNWGNGEYREKMREVSRRNMTKVASLLWQEKKFRDKQLGKKCCEICGEVVSGVLGLVAHMQKHSQVVISCDICGQVLNGFMGVGAHKQLHYPVIVSCDICGQTFKSASGLSCHKRGSRCKKVAT